MRRLLLAAALAITAVVVEPAPTPASALTKRAPTADKVLLVSLPRLTWGDLQAMGTPPNLARLLRRSAVASMSDRSIGPRTSLGEGYATVGAGNRATISTSRAPARLGAEDAEGGLAFDRDDTFAGEKVAAVHARRTGRRVDGEVLHIGVASIARANDHLLYGAEVGAFGTALREAGKRAAVIANADVGERLEPIGIHRDAALAVMDDRGAVAYGSVDEPVVASDDAAPFGIALDAAAVDAEVDRVWDDADVVLVEAGDLERADASAILSTPAAAARAKRAALRRFDTVVGHLLEKVDLQRDLVVVFGPAAPRRGEQLTVGAVAGPGFGPGLARSASTRRTGFVTLPDVAPTALDALGVAQPSSMTGTAMSSRGGRAFDSGRLSALSRESERAVFRDKATGPVSVAFIVFQVLVYGFAALALLRRGSRLLPWAGFGALMVLALPPLAFLSGTVPYDALGVVGYTATLFAAAAALAAAALAIGGGHPLRAPLVLVGLSLVVLVADVLTGGRLQIDTVLGYSPIVAGRFAGFGNLAAALVAVAAIVVATGLWGLGLPVAVAAAILGVVVVVDGHPALGSDVGGVLANVPAFLATLAVLAGIRLGWRRAIGVGLVTVAVVGVFAAVDLARPPSARTHLGRLVARVGNEGWSGFATVIERKLAANVAILTSSAWAYVIPVAFAFLAFLVWRPQGFMRQVLGRVPGLRACLVGAVVAGVLGFALNDSGVAVPAMMLAILLPYLTFLVVRTAPPEGTPAGT